MTWPLGLVLSLVAACSSPEEPPLEIGNHCVMGEIDVEPWSGTAVSATQFTCTGEYQPLCLLSQLNIGHYPGACVRTKPDVIMLDFAYAVPDAFGLIVRLEIDVDKNNKPIAARAGYGGEYENDTVPFVAGVLSIQGDFIDDNSEACVRGRLRVDYGNGVSDGEFVSWHCPAASAPSTSSEPSPGE